MKKININLNRKEKNKKSETKIDRRKETNLWSCVSNTVPDAKVLSAPFRHAKPKKLKREKK